MRQGAVRPGCGERGIFVERMWWRRTRQGSIVHPIAICYVCKSVIPPQRKDGEDRGEVVFSHEHPLRFVVLVAQREWRNAVGNADEELVRIVANVWSAGAREEEVEIMVDSLLKFKGEEDE